MTALSALLEAPAATTLAWTLLHFLWQGAALAAVLLLVIRSGRLAAGHRYAAGVVALALMLVAPVATFSALSRLQPPQSPAIGLAPSSGVVVEIQAAPVDPAPLQKPGETAAPEAMSAIVVSAWAAGVLVLAMRLLGGWWLARRLVRRISPVSAEIESMAVRLAGRLALDRVVRIAQSSAVAVPVMVGWFKPVVLFPASVLSGLSATQIEALLAHELAHVRRHDYLVNLLQSIVETLLFYHPAVWWVSRRVRVEREHCCDDIALGVCDRLVYATALSDLAALARPPQVALAATDGSLLQRVRRILAADDGPERGAGWLPVLLAIAIAALLVPAAAIVAREDAGSDAGLDVGRPFRAGNPPALGGAGQVPGGVAGGVPGGVPGGVAGGVPGGVPGGAPGGVVGGVANDEQEARAMADAVVPYALLVKDEKLRDLYALLIEAEKQQRLNDAEGGATGQAAGRSEQDRANLARQIEELQKQTEAHLRALEQDRRQLEEERLEAKYRAERSALDAEFKALEDQRARMKRQVELGLLSPTDLADVEQRLVLMQNKLQSMQTEFDLNRRELQLRRQETERMRELEEVMARRTLEQASALEQERQRRAVEERVKAETLGQTREQAEAMERLKAVMERLRAVSERLEGGIALDASETLRAGDVLIIEIRGEPDVPRAYTVGADGSIRLPLSRPVKVAGRTAAEVRQDIVKQLTARGLEGVDVAVTARRPR